MPIHKYHIPNLKFSKEHIETIFGFIGEAVLDLADFSFIYCEICIAYISVTKPFLKNPPDKFCGINSCSKRVKFGKNRSSRFREKRVTDTQTDTQTHNDDYIRLCENLR